MVSADVPDWQREKVTTFWQPSKKLIKSIRDYQNVSAQRSLVSSLKKKIAVLRYRFWSVVSGADIPLNLNIGGGISMPHANGIVIHPSAVIGVNCLIHQQVTLGVKRHEAKAPTLLGHVDIGAGAKIIGNIIIGKHALIGANSVVTKDVPDFAIVAGVPARVIGSTKETDTQC
ncbi:serine O-acetyltransferase [Methylophaga sp.]|uniref:serine O-acetyltransferase n=1 Tax=Methylophaga sp. TaxID=2024840 RepID=UPI003A8FA594